MENSSMENLKACVRLESQPAPIPFSKKFSSLCCLPELKSGEENEGLVCVHVRRSSDGGKKGGVPLEKSFSYSNSSCITRPLVEILRDLNRRSPDDIILAPPFITRYHLCSKCVPSLQFESNSICKCEREYSTTGTLLIKLEVSVLRIST